MFFLGILTSILFINGAMLSQHNEQVVLMLPYNVFFVPYFIISFVAIFYLIVHNRNLSSGSNKKIFTFHLIGFTILLCGGMIDFFNLSLMSSRMFLNIPSFTIFGVIGFGVITVYVFTERLIFLITEHAKLNLAYEDLERARSIISIGKSTAIINHEMRNALFSVLFHTEKIYEESPTEKSHVLCKQIIATINNLLNLNHELLDMSKKKILGAEGNASADIVNILQDVVATKFPDRKDTFSFLDVPSRQAVYCQKERMYDVIQRLFNYSLSKGSTEIKIRLYKDICAILLIIDDNNKETDASGSGMDGNGYVGVNDAEKLDLSMMRSTIEANGGHLSILVKKNLHPPSDGLIYNISLPNYAESPPGFGKEKDKVVLIKNGLDNLEPLIAVFNNVFMTPHFVQNHKEILNKFDESHIIIGSEEEILTFQSFKHNYRLFIILTDARGKTIVATSAGDELGVFSEQLLLCEMIKR
jgi:signal transduction histidine kinase